MRWLIDGNNVMGARPDGWWRDRAGAQIRLAELVDAWQHEHGQPVTLVFDGAGGAALAALDRSGFEVLSAGAAGLGSADDLIAQLASGAGAGLIVVTSDRGLRARLDDTVETEGAGTFRSRLDGSGGGPPAPRGSSGSRR